MSEFTENQPRSRTQRVVREYSVFWNQLSPRKRILLLQVPSRDANQPYNLAHHSKPVEIRIKPRSGLVEVDIPIPTNREYDISKGAKFAAALNQGQSRQTGTIAGKGDYGLAGGFGINSHIHVRTSRPSAPSKNSLNGHVNGEGHDEDEIAGAVMTSLTLGGKLRIFKHGDPIYAIGSFEGNNLHLSKVDGICSLQPQFHHLDAVADNDRMTSRSAATSDHPAPESEARAVNLTIKSTDEEQINVSEVDRMLRTMQEEPWQRLDWIDQSDSQAYSLQQHEMVHLDLPDAGHLISAMTESQYLDAISAPRIDSTRQGKRVMISRQWEDKTVDEEEINNKKPVDVAEGSGGPKASKSGATKPKIEVM